MIESAQDLKYYIQQDRIRNRVPINPSFVYRLKNFLVPNLIVKYLFLLRKAEYYLNCHKHSIIGLAYKYRFHKLGLKLGFSLPLNSFGPGLSLPHTGTIVVNGNATIGANCRLHVCVNIGASAGEKEAPKIGNNVYIGPGAIIFGNITIADNVTIGANATVNKSCNQEKVVLAGSPASIVKENYPNWIEFNKVNK